jgi:Phosphotransferase enzyme family
VAAFRALVVDNDLWVRDNALQAADPERGIEICVAKDKEEAAKLISSNFFHVAVVDLELRHGPRSLGEGRMVLSDLKSYRPSCRRLLLTQYVTKFPERVFETLRPDDPMVEGAIDKDDLDNYFRRYVAELAQAWSRTPVNIANLDEVYASLEKKEIRSGLLLDAFPLAITKDELQFVLASLFGQRYRRDDDQPDSDDVSSISLTAFQGGKSRSIVLHGRPVNRLGEEGLLCVVKVGPRREAEEELRRYEQYVRFRMSLRRRVELLGHASGDTLGAIAYSFAGEDPDEVGDLQTLLEGGDDRALVYFDEIYGEDGFSPEGEMHEDLGAFFKQAYNVRPRQIRKRVQAFADDQAEANGWQHRNDELRVKGGKLLLPTHESMGSGLLHMPYRSTVVHGDLNGSNVIIGDDQRSILIDYRHTARGPRALDYASMHASIRLSAPARERPVDQVAQDEALEYRLWEHEWGSGRDWWPMRAPGKAPFWLRAAAVLMERAYELPGLTRAEYAATCWLYALRVFRVEDLEATARLRILIWMSALQKVLADEAPAPGGQE